MISFVIPTLNEVLTDSLATLNRYLETLGGHTFELLIVDDSQGEKLERARGEIERSECPPNVRVRLVAGPHKGKGAAIRKGIEEAKGERGDIIILMDSDLPVPIEHTADFIRRIEAGTDIVIAERPASREFTSALRWALSRGLQVLQRTLVFHSWRFRDTQCGFKAFRATLLCDIAKEQIVDGGMYDLEYLYVAMLRGARIEAVTVDANAEIRESRIDAWKCMRRDPIDVARVKLHGVLGGYRHTQGGG